MKLLPDKAPLAHRATGGTAAAFDSRLVMAEGWWRKGRKGSFFSRKYMML